MAVSTYVDHEQLVAAVKDIDNVFFVSGFERAGRLDQHKAAINAFVAGGVQLQRHRRRRVRGAK